MDIFEDLLISVVDPQSLGCTRSVVVPQKCAINREKRLLFASFFQGIVMNIPVLRFKLKKFIFTGFVRILTHLNGLHNYWKVLKHR